MIHFDINWSNENYLFPEIEQKKRHTHTRAMGNKNIDKICLQKGKAASKSHCNTHTGTDK